MNNGDTLPLSGASDLFDTIVIVMSSNRVEMKSMQLPPAIIEQQALRLTLKHLGDGVTVKAVPHQVGWQVEMYGIRTESPLDHLMYDADGKLFTDINQVTEKIFAASDT